MVSNLLEGEADIETMNAMGYHASALGNYELDFGRGQLLRLEGQATFPFLAENLYNPDGTPAEIAKPYLLIDTQGVKLAVIGLVNRSLQGVANIGRFKVGPYDDALRATVAEVRAKGAQAVIVLAHLPMADLVALARSTPELHLPLMLGGFSHDISQQFLPDTGTWVINNGERWAAYGRIDLDVDPVEKTVRVVNSKQIWLAQRNPVADTAIAGVIDRALQRLGPDFNKSIGHTLTGLSSSTTACSFTLRSWLAADSTANFAMVNLGGIRQDIAAGGFTKADLISMLPFDDKVFRIKLTGQQLQEFRAPRGEPVGLSGLKIENGGLYYLRAQQPIDVNATYRVLVNDYLYNNSELLKRADPAPTVVFEDWRIPLYRWLADHKTAVDRPVEREMTLDKILRFGEAGVVADQ